MDKDVAGRNDDTNGGTAIHCGWIVAAVIAALLGAIPVVKRTVDGSSDLRGFHRIWKANLEAPMQPVRQNGEVKDDPDPYPPSSYVLFAPLGALPLWGIGLLWYVLNLACSWGIWRLSCRLLDLQTHERGALLCASVGVLPFWMGNLARGQNAPLLMLCILGAFWLARQQRSFWSGALIALASLVKVIPAVFLLPFLIRRDVKAVAGFAATLVVVVVLISSLFFGPRTNYEFHQRWWTFVTRGSEGPADPFHPDTMRSSTRSNNQSLEAVLARLMLPIPTASKPDSLKVNVVTADAAAWRMARKISIGAVLAACALALVGLRRRHAQGTGIVEGEASRSGTLLNPFAAEMAIVAPVMLIVSPIVWSHYYYWMFFPLAAMLARPEGRERSQQSIFALWMVATLLIGVHVSRSIGVNLWATAAVFTWFAWPPFKALGMRTVHDLPDASATENDTRPELRRAA